MEEIERASVTRGIGIDGDYRGRSRLRQITILSAEQWNEVQAELGAELPWTMRRANLLVEGIRLPQQKGVTIRIGDIDLSIVWKTAPCHKMDQAHPGLMRALGPDWRGGVVCRVLSERGTLALGDAVTLPENRHDACEDS